MSHITVFDECFLPHPSLGGVDWQDLNLLPLSTCLKRHSLKRYHRLSQLSRVAQHLNLPSWPEWAATVHASHVQTDAKFFAKLCVVKTEPGMHGITITESVIPGAKTNQPLLVGLTELFSAHAECFEVNGEYFLGFVEHPKITVDSFQTLIGLDMGFVLPKGANALEWHKLLTEAQMLVSGQLPQHSVVLSGVDTLPKQFEKTLQKSNAQWVVEDNRFQQQLQSFGCDVFEHLGDIGNQDKPVLWVREASDVSSVDDWYDYMTPWLENNGLLMSQSFKSFAVSTPMATIEFCPRWWHKMIKPVNLEALQLALYHA